MENTSFILSSNCLTIGKIHVIDSFLRVFLKPDKPGLLTTKSSQQHGPSPLCLHPRGLHSTIAVRGHIQRAAPQSRNCKAGFSTHSLNSWLQHVSHADPSPSTTVALPLIFLAAQVTRNIPQSCLACPFLYTLALEFLEEEGFKYVDG